METELFFLLYQATVLVQTGQMTVGDLTSFSLYTTWMGIALASLVKVYTEISKIQGASVRLEEFLKTPKEKTVKTLPDMTSLLPINFENVNFNYPNRSETVLKDLSLTFNPESKITAIVGASGSGKSTLVQLILGLYNVESGKLSFDNKPLDIDQVRSSIGYVSQEPILFSTSVKDNIFYGHSKSDEKSLIQAAKKAKAYDFITSLENGFDTIVGEQGSQLSGGQRQRVAIARALIRSPKLLILDEATSALDSESEKAIQLAIEDASQDCNVIIIAHRLSTVKCADKILVLDQGKLIEEGDFDELIELDGHFAKFVRTQELTKFDK